MTIKADLKERIIQTAREMFATYTYSKVSMDEIASKLGMSKKTLYNYFSGKEAILNESILHFYSETKEGLDKIMQREEFPLAERTKEIFSYVGTKISSINPYLIEDLQKNAPAVWNKIQQIKTELVFELFESLMDEGVSKGYIKKDTNPTLAVILYASAIDTIINPGFTRQIPQKMTKALPYTNAAVFEGLIEIIFRGILNE